MTDEEKPTDIAQMYKALGHPHRKKIIEIIGKNGKSGFKELHENLNISVGALYHHLDAMNQLITQDDQRKYILTEEGKLAYELLKTKEKELSSLLLKERVRSLLTSLLQIFAPKRFFLYISSNQIKCIPLAAVLVAFGTWIATQASLEFILVFPNSLSTAPPIWIATSFVVSWLALFSLCAVLVAVFSKRKSGNLAMLIGSAFSLFPLILFSCIWYSARILNFSLSTLAASLLLLPFQLWHISMMSTAISLSKGLKIDKAALIYFIVIFINLTYLIIMKIMPWA